MRRPSIGNILFISLAFAGLAEMNSFKEQSKRQSQQYRPGKFTIGYPETGMIFFSVRNHPNRLKRTNRLRQSRKAKIKRRRS